MLCLSEGDTVLNNITLDIFHEVLAHACWWERVAEVIDCCRRRPLVYRGAMERETNKNVPPAEEIVISRVPPPVTMTQPFDMQSDSTSVASSVKENKAAEGDNCDTMVNESSVGSSVDINELETFAGETGGGAVAIHVADADKGGVAEQKLEDLSSGCDGMNQASELGQEIEHSSPSREEIQTLEAVSPDSAARTRSPDAVDGTNQNSRPETPPQHVLDPEIKAMEPSTSRYVLLGLPIDALHAIASFLSPKDFCNFGLCSKGATKVSGDVFRRVRMHGFLCATEVVTAWVSAAFYAKVVSQCPIELTFRKCCYPRDRN